MQPATGQNFSRDYLGVVFDPYVKLPENGIHFSRAEYSVENIEVMLTVIHSRFSWVTTYGMGATRK